MADVLTLLREAGLTVEADFRKPVSTRGSFVRSVYNALNNGSDAAVVFAQNAPASEIDKARKAMGDDVFVCDEPYSRGDRKGEPKDAADVLAAIHRRNSNNPSAPSDTYGAVTFGAPIYNGETLVGFAVTQGQ